MNSEQVERSVEGVGIGLEEAVKTYREKLPELLLNAGKFVLIHGSEVAGLFDTYADAIQAGYERFGLDRFLVKQVAEVEPVHVIFAPPCHI